MFVFKKKYQEEIRKLVSDRDESVSQRNLLGRRVTELEAELAEFKSQDWAKEWETYYNKKNAYLGQKSFQDPYQRELARVSSEAAQRDCNSVRNSAQSFIGYPAYPSLFKTWGM